jgi:hypothetical protein
MRISRLGGFLRGIAAATAAGACSGPNAQPLPPDYAGNPDAGVDAGANDGPSNCPATDSSIDFHAQTNGYRPAMPVDYLAYRNEFPTTTPPAADAGATPASRGIMDYQPFGTPCATASNKAACMDRLQTMRTGVGGMYLVYTRGDTVGAVQANQVDMTAFLGPLDSVADALSIAVMAEGASSPYYAQATFCHQDDSGYVFRIATESDAFYSVRVLVRPDGTTMELERTKVGNLPYVSEGRRPAGLAPSVIRGCARPLGEYFARACHLEAASIVAFWRLEVELREHGAPARLCAKVRRARKDEVAHTRATRRLARAHAVEPPAVRATRERGARALVEMAVENAVEGCVRETYGAAVALFRAARASDPAVARILARIGHDETRHARLSWELAAWFRARLTAPERAVVDAAFARAVVELRSALGEEPAHEVARGAGAPDGAAQRALFAGLEAGLFAPELAATGS